MAILLAKVAATYIILSIMLLGLTYGSYLDRSTATLFLFLPAYLLQNIWAT